MPYKGTIVSKKKAHQARQNSGSQRQPAIELAVISLPGRLRNTKIFCSLSSSMPTSTVPSLNLLMQTQRGMSSGASRGSILACSRRDYNKELLRIGGSA